MDVTIPKTIGSSTFTRASSATYFNSSGKIASVGNDTLRLNYDPLNLTAAPLPLLEASTLNAFSYTESLTDGWTANNVSVNKNMTSVKAPDGTLTANYLSEDTTNNAHTLTKVTALSGSVPSTFSIYAQAGNRTQFTVKIVSGPVNATALYDLSLGTVSFLSNGSPASTAAIQSIGGGWYRCSLTQQAGAGTVIIGLYNGSSTYTGDGYSGVYLWGLQGEGGAVPSSYVPSVQTFTSRSTVGYYINSSGVLTSAAINTARNTYVGNALTLPPKLLLEKSATNLLPRSTDFLNAPWVNTNVTVATSQADPTGSSNGFLLTDNSLTVMGNITQSITVADSMNPYVFSVYVRKTTSATIFPGFVLAFTGGSFPITIGMALNTNNGALIQNNTMGAPTYTSVVEITNYWRISIGISNNLSGNTTIACSIYPSVDNGGTGTWVVTGNSSINTWGAQLEQSFGETSFIVTAGSATTRGADVYTSTASVRQADVSSYGLIYTNIPENDFPLWSNSSTYGVDVAGSNSVIYNHVKYASLQASNTGHQPDISPTWWSVIGATNAYAMFDTQVGTQTVGTVGGHIVVYVQIGALSSLNFINVSADTITVSVFGNYNQVYTNTIDMTGGTTGIPITDYSLTGLPTYSDAYVKLDIYSATTAPAIGNFVVGTNYYVGSTEISPTIGIVDYSVKTVDAFGNPTLTVRGYAKRMNTKSLVDDSQVDFVARLLAQVRAKPCVWNANTNDSNLTSNYRTSLIIYGYYKDWEIDLFAKSKSYLTCTVEGLI